MSLEEERRRQLAEEQQRIMEEERRRRVIEEQRYFFYVPLSGSDCVCHLVVWMPSIINSKSNSIWVWLDILVSSSLPAH